VVLIRAFVCSIRRLVMHHCCLLRGRTPLQFPFTLRKFWAKDLFSSLLFRNLQPFRYLPPACSCAGNVVRPSNAKPSLGGRARRRAFEHQRRA